MKRTLFLLAIIILALAACKEKSSFTVKGTIKGEKKKYINLSRVDVNTAVLLDSAKVSNSGQFKFRVKATDPDFYQLGYSSSEFITILAGPGEKINLSFSGNKLYNDYRVKGSDGTEKLRILDSTLAVTTTKLDSLSTLYNKASTEEGFDIRGPELEQQFTTILNSQRKKNIAFIINNLHSLASIKALYQKINPDTYVLYDPKDLQYLKIVTDTLTKYYPRSKHVQALASDFSREMGELYTSKVHEMAKNIPETKLDPDLMTVDGKRIALSSLKGKYVLLTFWSLRSQACLEENLRLKEYYRQYNRKGFEIYQINIDENEEAWRNAVKFDELPWISTREDDPADPLNVKIFNVRSLPTNFLFDKEGRIIGTNLHGRALDIKLNQLFN